MFIVPLNSIMSADSAKISDAQVTATDNDETESFSDMLKNAVSGVKAMEEESAQNSYELAMGYTDDLEGIMIQSAKTATAIEVTSKIVSSAVTAYKEILNTQV